MKPIRKVTCTLCIVIFAVSQLAAQKAVSPYHFPFGYPFPEYHVAGGSHPGLSNDYLDNEPDPERELKRIGQYALRLIQTDSAQKAVDYTNYYRANFAPVLTGEMYFMRSMAETQLGWLDQAVSSMKKAIEEGGLPPERFIAGPRRMFSPLYRHPRYLEIWEKQVEANKLVHGPMLGAMTDSSAKVWVRTATETTVRVAASTSSDFSDAILSKPVLSRSDRDFTAQVQLIGLEPSTRYHYQVLLGPHQNIAKGSRHSFRTYPAEQQPATFSIAFGGCAGYVPPNERIWDTIDHVEPLAFLTLGDNVYIDDPESPDQARYLYYQRQSRPEFRRLTGSSPVYSIWDDHDFGMDDSWGGPRADIPYWKPMVWEIFTQNWANPAYESGDQPGGWYDFMIGDVHVIMLDTRYYREDSGRFEGQRKPGASMLGPNQRAWLKSTLKNSDATFTVLVSSIPWHYDAKGDGFNKVDGWAGYRQERAQIFSRIDDFKLEGVLLLSSDRHRSDAWLTERTGSYNLYEFASGQFTNQHTHDVLAESLFGYNKMPSFGLLHFNTQLDDPTVTYQIININGQSQEEITIRHSQLEFQK